MADPSGIGSTPEPVEDGPVAGEATDVEAGATQSGGSAPVTEAMPVSPAAEDRAPRPDPASEEPVSEPPAGAQNGPAPEIGADDDPAAPTEVFATHPPEPEPAAGRPERRFTAPSGFDAGSTEKIETPPDPATEVLSQSPLTPTEPVIAPRPPRTATPQSIPPRTPLRRHRSWGWVLALILVIAALAAVAILGTVWLTRSNAPKVSQEDLVRETIQNFDVAVQKGDLATLRGITCGTTRDAYVNYDERAWADTHAKVAAAKQYPVVANIDQVVVNGAHAEANVTTFMAYAPQIRSARSFDLQYVGEGWKICQAPTG
jgi:hypothetical protein